MNDIDVVRSSAPDLSRRTLVAGAAWSVPVVVGLAAMPAAAASTERFESYFSWVSNGTFKGLTTGISLSNAKLQYIGTGSAEGSFTLATSPEIAGLVTEITAPSSGSLSLKPGDDVSVAFTMTPKPGSSIPNGSYTINATIVFTIGNKSHTLIYGGPVSI